MKQLYIQSWGLVRDGDFTFVCTECQESASLYDEVQANIDCNLLNRFSPRKVTPETGRERLFFENFRVLMVTDGLFCIAFESRTEAERIAFVLRT